MSPSDLCAEILIYSQYVITSKAEVLMCVDLMLSTTAHTYSPTPFLSTITNHPYHDGLTGVCSNQLLDMFMPLWFHMPWYCVYCVKLTSKPVCLHSANYICHHELDNALCCRSADEHTVNWNAYLIDEMLHSFETASSLTSTNGQSSNMLPTALRVQ